MNTATSTSIVGQKRERDEGAAAAAAAAAEASPSKRQKLQQQPVAAAAAAAAATEDVSPAALAAAAKALALAEKAAAKKKRQEKKANEIKPAHMITPHEKVATAEYATSCVGLHLVPGAEPSRLLGLTQPFIVVNRNACVLHIIAYLVAALPKEDKYSQAVSRHACSLSIPAAALKPGAAQALAHPNALPMHLTMYALAEAIWAPCAVDPDAPVTLMFTLSPEAFYTPRAAPQAPIVVKQEGEAVASSSSSSSSEAKQQ
jgi:hypothetical protein